MATKEALNNLDLVALRGGKNNGEGNVFVFNRKTKLFGPVCDDFWSHKDVSFKYYFSS